MTRRKKILIIAASLCIGGAEKVARDIALHAPQGNYEIHYLVFGDAVGAYEAQVEQKGCKVFHWDIPSANYAKFFFGLLRHMKRERYDAVHAHNMFNCGFSMLAAAMAGVPTRIAHAHSAMTVFPGSIGRVYESVMRFLICKCSTDLVACGIAAGKRLFGEKTFAKRGNLILNGIDVQAFAYSEQSRNALRLRKGIQNCFVIGHTGHLAKVKNQSFLLDLMPEILKERPDSILLLLGEGEDRPMLEQKIKNANLCDHVIMTGNVQEVSDYLSAMDVFVFPSLYEGLPLSVLEVQANGLPCVISDSVPSDVFLTDLIHPMSLNRAKEEWTEKILLMKRTEPIAYQKQLTDSDYSADRAMEKIYRIYDRGEKA